LGEFSPSGSGARNEGGTRCREWARLGAEPGRGEVAQSSCGKREGGSCGEGKEMGWRWKKKKNEMGTRSVQAD
jgi:hypothetical protein